MSKTEDTRPTSPRGEPPADETAEKTVVTEIIFSTREVLGSDDRAVAFDADTTHVPGTGDDTVNTIGPPELRDSEPLETTVVDYIHQEAGMVSSWEPTRHDVQQPAEPADEPPELSTRHDVQQPAEPAADEPRELSTAKPPAPPEATATRERAALSDLGPAQPLGPVDTTPPASAAEVEPLLTVRERRLLISAAAAAGAVMVLAYLLGYWQGAS